MEPKTPSLFNNRMSVTGAAIAIVAFTMIVFLTLLDTFQHTGGHPYMGILTFIVLPIIMNTGLLLVIVGAVRTHRRLRAGEPVQTVHLRIDFANARHRRTAVLLAVGAPLFLVMSAAGSYKAYEATETVEFCGLVCHNVMKPEYTAYQNSPHSRVACVECHIGSGATWFVRSKLSGSYQVYSVLFHKYHRPIETPVKNLRPARETCEQCHWPRAFYSAKLQAKNYYLSDDKNTLAQANLLVKVGGGDAAHGGSEGIHYHMYISQTVRYVATDPKHLVIPYVEARTPDGKVEVYRSTETPITDAQVARSEKHLVDCIECHNRPTHRFAPPDESVNRAMALGQIDPRLPEVKREAVELLKKPYKTEGEALQSIRQSMLDFYKTQHPDVSASKSPEILAAVATTQRIYSQNFFPEMRVNWQEFPDHIGHLYSDGCFRCHDGKHVSSTGKVITRDCNACHTILAQTVDGKQKESLAGLAFQHPIDIGDAWKENKCTSCHARAE